jgi:hypothetical protein
MDIVRRMRSVPEAMASMSGDMRLVPEYMKSRPPKVRGPVSQGSTRIERLEEENWALQQLPSKDV